MVSPIVTLQLRISAGFMWLPRTVRIVCTSTSNYPSTALILSILFTTVVCKCHLRPAFQMTDFKNLQHYSYYDLRIQKCSVDSGTDCAWYRSALSRTSFANQKCKNAFAEFLPCVRYTIEDIVSMALVRCSC